MSNMNPMLVQSLSQLVGIDLQAEMQKYEGIRQAVGAALNQEQQIFVSEHYKHVQAFIQTDEGKSAVKAFVTAWQQSKKT